MLQISHSSSFALVAAASLILLPALVSPAQAWPRPLPQSAPTPKPAPDPAFVKMMQFMPGGLWQTKIGTFVAEFHYELIAGGKGIRGTGVIAKGLPAEEEVTTMYGWDPDKKATYYIDFHGHETVYKGTVKAADAGIAMDFAGLVGDHGLYRSAADWPDHDTMHATIMGQNKEGAWVPLHTFTFKRLPDPAR